MLVRESLVRACVVVETHVLGDDASKMFLAEDEDVIFRRRRSRKKSTKTSQNRMSYVSTKSHAHVTWLRRNVDQPWPSPRGLEPGMYRCSRSDELHLLAVR